MTGNETQTKITLTNLGDFTVMVEKRPIATNTSSSFFGKELNEPIKNRDPAAELKALNNRYYNDIEFEIKSWVKKIPVITDSPKDARRKENVIQNLIDRVRTMDLSKRDSDAQKRLKNEIESCLDNLNLWYPGSNADREAFKDGLRENLFERISHRMEGNISATQPGYIPQNYGPRLSSNARQSDQSYANYGAQTYAHGQQPFGKYEQQNIGTPSGITMNVVPPNENANIVAQPKGAAMFPAQFYGITAPYEAQPYSTKAFQETQPYENTNNLAQPDGILGNGAKSFGVKINAPYANVSDEAQSYGIANNATEPSVNVVQPYGYGNTSYFANSYGNASDVTQPHGLVGDRAQPSGKADNVTQSYGSAVNAAQPYRDPNNVPQFYGPPAYAVKPSRISRDRTYSNIVNTTQPYQDGTNVQHYGNAIDGSQPFENANNVVQPRGATQRYEANLNTESPMASENPARTNIKILDSPNYENYSHTPDNTTQPRRPSLKSSSNLYINNGTYDPNGLNKFNDSNNKQTLTAGPTTDQTDRTIISQNSNDPNLTNHSSFTVAAPKAITNKRHLESDPLLRTYCDLKNKKECSLDCVSSKTSYYIKGVYDLEACKKCFKTKLNPHDYSNSSLKCTTKSTDLCGCPDEKYTMKEEDCCGIKLIDIEREVAEWLNKCNFSNCYGNLNRQEITEGLVLHISPYLNQPCDGLNKAVLKTKILSYIRGLGVCGDATSCNIKNVHHKLANELANRLVGIASRLEYSGPASWECNVRTNRRFRFLEKVRVGSNDVNREDLRHDLMQEFELSTSGTALENNKQLLEVIADLVINRIELVRQDATETIRNDIISLLENTNGINSDEISNIVNSILKTAREIVVMIVNINNRTDTTITARPCLSGVLSIFTSEHEITPNFAATSTPKNKKNVSKLSPEEKEYTNNIASVIREWIKTVPSHFKNLKDYKMNKVMTMDLAASIADHAKLGQLMPQQNIDTEKIMTYYIYKWLVKFEILQDLERAEPHVETLVNHLQEIDVPKLTRPRHGTRQEMKNIKYQETEAAWTDPFIPDAQDILEDEISIWMNECPSSYFQHQNESAQNKLISSLVKKLQKHNKNDDVGVSNEIKKWLKKVLKHSDNQILDELSENLKERINKLPQNATLAAKMEEKLCNKKTVSELVTPTKDAQIVNYEENDKTIKEFIIKYVEHSYDQEDPLAKAVYAKLLTLELQRLSPLVRKEVYEGKALERVTPDRLFRELVYVKDISDWLKTLPFDNEYNRVGNNERIEFCLFLAKDIAETEEDRLRAPDKMNYDDYIGNMVCQFIHLLPLKLDLPKLNKYIRDLLITIFGRREEKLSLSPERQWQNIADFLDDYVRLNGQDIADNEVKLEVWATRLLREIKMMITENDSITDSEIHEKLAQIAKPGDETVKRFHHELDYAKEISDWLKNMPLVNNVDEEMIRDLAEKMTDFENETDDSELIQYIKQWISQLPLDDSKQIDVPFVIQQLFKRKHKVIKDEAVKVLPMISRGESDEEEPKTCGAKLECRGCCPVDDPGSTIVQVIKDWCDKLPLDGADDNVKSCKIDMSTSLYQKIIEINDVPHIAHNDILYMESLSEKVRELLSSLPKNVKLNKDDEKLRTELLRKVKHARLFCKEVNMGDDYLKELEHAIEVAIPNPAPRGPDPAFDMYKENLAELFILENFDHSNDADKLKYEKVIKKEIEKFSPYAQKRKGIQITEENLCNDTISTLFGVIMPEEKALVDNVEEIKTKCEILDWFEHLLPLRPVSGPEELIERGQKVQLLARKIHALEYKKNPEHRIHKEITKWLRKVPVLPGEEENIDSFANNLQQILKTSRGSRKCLKASDVDIEKEKNVAQTYDPNEIWVNPNTTFDTANKTQQPSRPKAGDIIIDIVEQWSKNVPLPSSPKETTDTIRNDLVTRMIKKICELNSTPNVFNNDQTYSHLINQEIEKALEAIPQTNILKQSRYALMHQLTSAIDSTKPLIREERALYQYKNDLNKVVTSVLCNIEHLTPQEQNLLAQIREEVVTDFIEYQYNKDDEEGKQFYKNKILNALTEYNSIGEHENSRNEIISDTLVEVNKLLCELKKILPPEEKALKNEVEELRMKREVNNFLNNVSPTEPEYTDSRRVSLRDSLAKQLNDIEKTGHDEENNKKMQAAVSRTLKKLGAELKEEEISMFIDRLEKNEAIRKAPAHNERAYGDHSLPEKLGTNYQWVEPGPFAASAPNPNGMYATDYQQPLSPPPLNVPPYPRIPRPPSPSQALKAHMGHPPTDSVSYGYPHAVFQRAEASVYRPDYIPPNWKLPTPPPKDNTQKLLVVRHSLPPSPGSIGSSVIPVQQKLTQQTQTASFSSGITQTPSHPPGAQHYGPRPPEQYGPPGYYQISPQFPPGQYTHQGFVPPAAPQFDRRLPAGMQQVNLPPGAGRSSEETLEDGCLCEVCRWCHQCESDSSFECRGPVPFLISRPFMFC